MADWFLLDPGTQDPERQERISTELDPGQIVDLAGLLMKARAFSKVTMALGLEPEVMNVTVIDG